MRRTAPDIYSYAQVRVTTRTLTITPKDMNGEVVRDQNGKACGPFTISAR